MPMFAFSVTLASGPVSLTVSAPITVTAQITNSGGSAGSYALTGDLVLSGTSTVEAHLFPAPNPSTGQTQTPATGTVAANSSASVALYTADLVTYDQVANYNTATGYDLVLTLTDQATGASQTSRIPSAVFAPPPSSSSGSGSGGSGGSIPPASLAVTFYDPPTSITAGDNLGFTLYYTLGGSGSVDTEITGTIAINGSQVGTLVSQAFSGTAPESGYLNAPISGGTVPSSWAGQELTVSLYVGGQLSETTTLQVADPTAPASFKVWFEFQPSSIPAGSAAQVSVWITNVGGQAGTFTRVTGTSTASDGTTTTWSTLTQDSETIAAGNTLDVPLYSAGAVGYQQGTATLTVTSQTGQTASETLDIL